MQTPSEVYNLFEFSTLDGICTPVKNTARVKYTCFDVCDQLLIFGANSGSLYLFLRKPLQFLKVLSNKDGPLTIVCISPNSHYVAFATSKSIVIVLELKIDIGQVGRRGQVHSTFPKYVKKSTNHLGAEITCLQWNDLSDHLFIADGKGKITVMKVASKKTQTLFQVSSSMIAQLDSRVVQMDFAQGKLLVSSLTNCFLCDTTKEQYSQIGTKPRDGEFGACFYNNIHSQTPTIYTARPGSRLWEVDFEGCVLCTHQFKQELAKTALYTIPVYKGAETLSTQPDLSPKSSNFPRLIVVRKRFLLTWLKEKLVIFDPVSARVLLWTMFPCEILDVRACADELYMWSTDSSFRNFCLLTVDCGICRLLSEDCCWKLGAMLCCLYENAIIQAQCRKWLPRHLLCELAVHLQQNNEVEMSTRIKELISKLEELPTNVQFSTDCANVPSKYHVESGIYVVHRPNGTTVEKLKITKLANGVVQSATAKKNHYMTGSSKVAPCNYPVRLSVGGRQQMQNSFNDNLCMKKIASVTDIHVYEEKTGSLRRGQSLSEMYHHQPVHALLPFTSAYFWDLDPVYGYEALASLNPGAAFDGLKNSLSSTYQSGKETILSTFGVLEDHLKSLSVEDPSDLLDVNNGHHFLDGELHEYNGTAETYATDSVIRLKGSGQEGTAEDSRKTQAPLVSDMDLSALLHISQLTVKRLGCSDVQMDLEAWIGILIDTQEMMYCKLYYNHQDSKYRDPVTATSNSLKRSVSCNALIGESDRLCTASPTHEVQESCSIWRQSCPCLPSDSNANQALTYDSHTRVVDKLISDPVENAKPSTLSFEDVLWWQDFSLRESGSCEAFVGSIANCPLCSPIIFIHDPWGLNFDSHKLITELAMLCFRDKIFGRIMFFSSQLACLTRIENLESNSGDTFGDVEKNLDIYRESIVDHARSVFVRQFFHLLKPMEIFQELRQDETSTFLTWRTIINGIAELMLDNNALELKCFGVLLSSIWSEATSETVEKLCDSDFICARDVLYVDHLRPSSTHRLFLDYMDAKCKMQSSGSTQNLSKISHSVKFQNYKSIEMVLCEDPIVHVAWLTAVIKDSNISSKEVNCHCGMPRAWSHLYPWKRKDQMQKILILNVKTQEQCLELCKKYGFWTGYLQLSNSSVSRKEVFSLLVQLCDINLLKDPFNIAYLPQTVDEWQMFVRLMITQREEGRLQCLFCRSQLHKYSVNNDFALEEDCLSFEDIAYILFKICTANVVLKLMTEVIDALPQVRISSAFYRCCVANSLLHQQRASTFTYKISENMDTYVWSHHKNYAYPQIRACLLSEIHEMESDTLSHVLDRCCFLEDPQCHWGVTLDPSAVCGVCSIPLVVQVTSSNQCGIRIFPCGHAYHLQCTQSRSCPMC